MTGGLLALRGRRRWIVLPATAAACLTLAGCGSTPLPSVTVTSVSQTVTSKAVSYQRGSKLAHGSPALLSLNVHGGDVLQISIDKAAFQRGWLVQLDDKDLLPRQRDRVASVTLPKDLGKGQPLLTVLTGPVDGSDRASGLWVFKLVPQS